jgi:putative acetyltransferase
MDGETTFRILQPTDNPFLASLIREVFSEFGDVPKVGTVYDDPTTDHLFELFRQAGSLCRVAEVDGRMVGCCGIYPTCGLPPACAELVKYYLSKTSRGKGIGKRLIELCIHDARQMGYKTLYIESFPQFTTAVSMYQKLGFTQIHHPLGHSGHTACNVWMIKEI